MVIVVHFLLCSIFFSFFLSFFLPPSLSLRPPPPPPTSLPAGLGKRRSRNEAINKKSTGRLCPATLRCFDVRLLLLRYSPAADRCSNLAAAAARLIPVTVTRRHIRAPSDISFFFFFCSHYSRVVASDDGDDWKGDSLTREREEKREREKERWPRFLNSDNAVRRFLQAAPEQQ